MAWIWIILGLLYLISPYDLFPDFFPIRGWIDDAVILILLVRYVMRIKKTKQSAQGSQQQQRDDTRRATSGESGSAEADPYAVLGVSPSAKKDEVQSAYRRLAKQYHPDKVAHLGAELQELAEKRFKEIQHAYEKIING